MPAEEDKSIDKNRPIDRRAEPRASRMKVVAIMNMGAKIGCRWPSQKK
jgi:hypothetical protein